uniref:Putative transporter fused subunits of ABC superfamily: ATP-binding components n=1 Tax=mine drainage metagenome TaxID=410659 RepID=E6QUG3_9ZZZZ
MNTDNQTERPPAIEINAVSKRFGTTVALQAVSAQVKFGCLTGIVGPDGAGKTTLLRLLAALLTPSNGQILVAGHDSVTELERIHAVTGYMPQRFGLYEDLSVLENLNLYARLRAVPAEEQTALFERLLAFTSLGAFTDRLAGRLSGGMKQKLGLACALMGKPKVLLLDEPSVGVDPVSRQELWRMVQALTTEGMAVIWSTAYLDEAERCESVLLLNHGQIAYDGAPSILTQRLQGRCFRLNGFMTDRRQLLMQALDLPSVCDGAIQGDSLRVVLRAGHDLAELRQFSQDNAAQIESIAPRFEDAFIDLLGGGSGGRSALAERFEPIQNLTCSPVECHDLTCQFGDFIATDHVTFKIRQGEIFGLLGPNGAGKSTTFRMLCGLLKPTSGEARVMDIDLRHAGSAAKRQIGYMAQKFSLYGLLSVKQNLQFFAGAYGLDTALQRTRIDEMVELFQLASYLNAEPESLPLGTRQRLALACALMHRPAVLFLDEPTSGVDPLTRREFWTHINGLVRKGVTILVTTHFMEEAEYCDRVALMLQAKVIALDTPDALKRSAVTAEVPDPTMEQAFIHLIQTAQSPQQPV